MKQQKLVNSLEKERVEWSYLPLFGGEPVVVVEDKFVKVPAQMNMFDILGQPSLETMKNVVTTDVITLDSDSDDGYSCGYCANDLTGDSKVTTINGVGQDRFHPDCYETMSNDDDSSSDGGQVNDDSQADDDGDGGQSKISEGGAMVYLSIQEHTAPNGKKFKLIQLIWGEYVGSVGMSGEIYSGDTELWAHILKLQTILGLTTTSGPMSATYYHLPQATLDMILEHKAVLVVDGVAQPYQHHVIKEADVDFGPKHQGYEAYGRLVQFSYVGINGATCTGKGEIIYFDYQPRLNVYYTGGKPTVSASNNVCVCIDYEGSFYIRSLGAISNG